MLGSVAGARDGGHGSARQRDLVAGAKGTVRKMSLCSGWHEELGARRCPDLQRSGDEVGVQVRLEHMRDTPGFRICRLKIAADTPVGVDERSLTVAEANQVRAVAQPFVDERDDFHELTSAAETPRRIVIAATIPDRAVSAATI